MTANFKKRMLTDYTVSQTTSDAEELESISSTSEAPLKRLRLNVGVIRFHLREITSAQEAENSLEGLRAQLQEFKNVVGIDELVSIGEKLRGLFLQFRGNSEISCVIISTLGVLLALPLGSSCLQSLRQFFLKIVIEPASAATRSFLVRILHQAGLAHSNNHAFLCHIVAILHKFLSREEVISQSVLTAACLDAIGDLHNARGARVASLTHLWRKFESDPSNDVRIAAYRMLQKLSSRGMELDLKMYGKLSYGLEDLCPEVRSCAMDLIVRLSKQASAHQVPKSQGVAGETMNLVDDVFCKICDRVNDWEIQLRAEAATLLGIMDGVTLDYVLQTVDKKLMSDLRVKVAGHDRQKQLYESGEWSSGRKWADDAPKERLQKEDVKLMSIGATGAFVLALEDQFQQVRAAAVVSMAQLAAKHPSFGSICAEFLVDMFNDEIHDVRLKALQMFPLLGQDVELREDQLEMVLTVLQDASLEIREGLRLILPTLKYSDAKLVTMVFSELLNNFRQYPSDHGFICACLAKLGRNNAKFVADNSKSLLNIHPFLQGVEPKSDDKIYVATITLVCNAATQEPGILNLFMDFHFRHYLLYRYKYPDWLPLLENVGSNALNAKIHRNTQGYSRANLQAYLNAFRRCIGAAKNFESVLKMIKVVTTGLAAICEQDIQLESTGSWLDHQCSFTIKFVEDLKKLCEPEEDIAKPWENEQRLTTRRSLVDLLKSQFSRMTTVDAVTMLKLSVLDRLIDVLLGGKRSGDLVDLDAIIVTECQELKEKLKTSGEKIPFWLQEVSEISRIPEQKLLLLLKSEIPVPELPSDSLQLAKVKIKQPLDNEDDPAPAVAGTIHKIPFEAELRGLDDAVGVFICLTYPDGKQIISFPASKDICRRNNITTIKTDIAVSLAVWMSTAAIRIHVGRVILGKHLDAMKNYQILSESDMKQTIALSDTVSYFLTPRAQ